MRAFVGVTDSDWYRYLAARPHLSEVNFWRPSGRGFGAISTSEPFLFKTHAPHNRLVGGGFLSDATLLRVSEAWEFFGDGNGVSGLDEFRRRIAHYRRMQIPSGADPEITCILLRDVFFVQPDDGIPAPPDFAGSVVVGKTYDESSASYSYLEQAMAALLRGAVGVPQIGGPVFGEPATGAARLGQQAFKALVLTAYQRRCAVTGGRIAPTLQAAHIRPVSDGGQHRLDNGLLLRSDVHILYDAGYLGVNEKFRLRVSPRLRSDFGNGDEFYGRSGERLLVLPSHRRERPDVEALQWHMETRFKSA